MAMADTQSEDVSEHSGESPPAEYASENVAKGYSKNQQMSAEGCGRPCRTELSCSRSACESLLLRHAAVEMPGTYASTCSQVIT